MLKRNKYRRRKSRSRSRSKRLKYTDILPNFVENICSSERWRIEWGILREYWKMVLFGALMQYIHSSMTNIAYVHHVQGERLHDLGFEILPELEPWMQSFSEYIMFFNLFWIILVGLGTPFVYKRPAIHSMMLLVRTITVISWCLVIRCICFTTTSLPGPADHCQPDSVEYNPPQSVKEIFTRVDALGGCGDLIFSAHTMISLSLAIAFYIYGQHFVPRRVHQIATGGIVASYVLMSILIIASRKHYTVDVFIAWYTTPMSFYSSYWFFDDQQGEESWKRYGKHESRRVSGLRLKPMYLEREDIQFAFPLPKR